MADRRTDGSIGLNGCRRHAHPKQVAIFLSLIYFGPPAYENTTRATVTLRTSITGGIYTSKAL